jgi:hypothetical protein
LADVVVREWCGATGEVLSHTTTPDHFVILWLALLETIVILKQT